MWVLAGGLLLLPTLALAASARDDDRPRKPASAGASAEGREQLERFRRGEEQRRQRRATAEERERRRVSRRAYRDQRRAEALRLARAEQPVLVESPVWEPLELEPGERVARFFGETSAQIVDEDGDRSAVDSTLPLRSDLGSGEERLADLSLVQRGGGLEAVNPLVATRIDEQVQEGVELGGDGFGVRLETPSTSEAGLVDGRAFFPNALADTDMFVLPTPKGVQISLQVRSAEAPEQAVLALEVPAGARLEVVGEEGGTSPGDGVPGSARIVRADDVLAVIQPPVAWDADRQFLEGVRYTVEGDELVVHYPHRSADVLYPLAVDPQVDRFRQNDIGNVDPNGSWVIGHYDDQERAAWNYGFGWPGGENFSGYPGQQGYTSTHNWVIALSSTTNRWYANDAYGQWIWWAPRQSWINRVDFADLDHATAYPGAMCLAMGIYSFTRWNWEPGRMYNGYGQYVGSSPWIGGPAPGGSCSAQTNIYRTHFSDGVTPGNVAVYRMFAYGDGTRPYRSDSNLEGASVTVEDAQHPSVSSATTSPGGWVRSATITTTVNSRDAAPGTPAEQGGLGMFVNGLQVPKEGGGTAQQTAWGNCHLRLTRCTEGFTFTHTYHTDGDLDPNTAGVQRMPSGVNSVYGDVYDATSKGTRYDAGTVKIDRLSAVAGVSGFEPNELLRGRNYTVTGTTSDSQSGPHSVTIKLDGATKASRSDCPASENPCRLEWTLDAADPALAEGTHTITVEAQDQVGNPIQSRSREFRIDRTKPTYEVDGSLLPTDTGWVARGDQDLVVNAVDDPGSVPATGATYIEAKIDGNPIEPPADQPCAAGACALAADFLTTTDGLADGPHTLTIVVRDGAGNTADSPPIGFKLERDAPSLTLGGTLKAAEGQTLNQDSTYILSAAATDTAGPTAQSGMGRIDVAVDGDAPDEVVQPCPLGGCSMTRTYTFTPADYEPGPHTFQVTAADIAGNTRTEQFTVNSPEPAPLQCPTGPAPTVQNTPVGLDPMLALELFRNRLPEAFEPHDGLTLDDDLLLKPALDATDSAAFKGTGSFNEIAVDRQAADGATLETHTDFLPVCFAPAQVGDKASSPTSPIAGTTSLYANASPGIDLAIRPALVGAESFMQVREPTASQEFSWNVGLQPGQQLQQLSDGSVAIVMPIEGPDDSTPETDPLAPQPSIAERRQAIKNTQLQQQQAADVLDRALRTNPHEIIAVLPRPWAYDAQDRSVATSLTVSGSRLTMRIEHSPLSSTYPVVAGSQVNMTDSLDEYESQKADAETADYTFEEADAYEPPAGDPPEDPPVASLTVDEPAEWAVDGSALESEHPAEDADSDDVQLAEADAAKNKRSPRKPSIHSTESHPALFYSPDRQDLGFGSYRPIVPYKVVKMLDSPSQEARDRADLWTDWVRTFKKSVRTDVSFQFAPGQKRAPTASEYRRHITRFLDRYGDKIKIGAVSAWNEPQLGLNTGGRKNPTFKNPLRAARFWKIAQAVCHPKGKAPRCGNVVAGEYAGYRGDPSYKLNSKATPAEKEFQRTRRYEADYRAYLFSQLKGAKQVSQRAKKHAPYVWGFHAYGDLRTYHYRQRSSRAAISERYFRQFRGDGYRLPRVWMTAGGSYYRQPCSMLSIERVNRYCKKDSELADNRGKPGDGGGILLFGERVQANALALLLRRMSLTIRDDKDAHGKIERFYYYHLHNVANASAYPGGRADVLGRKPGLPEEWGLVGNSSDTPGYPDNARVYSFRCTTSYSADGRRRRAFSVLRNRSLNTVPPKNKCSTPGP